ncbi:MAG: hypothetical protein NUV65_03080 [Candidatus Roizmanbacteria bacterium]|nr:hypothetical protein [Candidatus Roizmanbacteria bacterium]
MSDIERREIRYFFVSSLEKEIRTRIEGIEELLLVEYPNSVTETLYFTYGQKLSYVVPAGQLVRIRRYVSGLSETMELGHENVFLEVKINHSSDLNSKNRLVLPGATALSFLTKGMCIPSVSNALQSITHLPPLFPTIATQTERRHWIHKSGVRITFDKEIRTFAFLEGSLKGCHIGSLGEGKIEFKLPKSSQIDTSLVQRAGANEMCTHEDPAYLERRLRECFFQNIIERGKH